MAEQERRGFGISNKRKETKWDIYLGKVVCAHINGNTVYGVLKEVNAREGYTDFQPSFVAALSGEGFIEEDMPTRVDGLPQVVRPIKKFSLEKLAADYNDRVAQERAKK